MGIINSNLRNKKRKLIHDVGTLNNTIHILTVLESNMKKELGAREKQTILLSKKIKEYKIILGKLCKNINDNRGKRDNDMCECKICMEKQIEVIVIPCGHCFCNVCIENSGSCPLCRNNIVKTNKIYLG